MSVHAKFNTWSNCFLSLLLVDSVLMLGGEFLEPCLGWEPSLPTLLVAVASSATLLKLDPQELLVMDAVSLLLFILVRCWDMHCVGRNLARPPWPVATLFAFGSNSTLIVAVPSLCCFFSCSFLLEFVPRASSSLCVLWLLCIPFASSSFLDNWSLRNSSTQQSGQAFINTFQPPKSFFFRNRFWGWWMQRPRESGWKLWLLSDDWAVLLWRMGSRLSMFLVILVGSLCLTALACGKSTRRHSSFSGSIRLTWCRCFNSPNACDMSSSSWSDGTWEQDLLRRLTSLLRRLLAWWLPCVWLLLLCFFGLLPFFLLSLLRSLPLLWCLLLLLILALSDLEDECRGSAYHHVHFQMWCCIEQTLTYFSLTMVCTAVGHVVSAIAFLY